MSNLKRLCLKLILPDILCTFTPAPITDDGVACLLSVIQLFTKSKRNDILLSLERTTIYQLSRGKNYEALLARGNVLAQDRQLCGQSVIGNVTLRPYGLSKSTNLHLRSLL